LSTSFKLGEVALQFGVTLFEYSWGLCEYLKQLMSLLYVLVLVAVLSGGADGLILNQSEYQVTSFGDGGPKCGVSLLCHWPSVAQCL
jgi:hypothetical protein